MKILKYILPFTPSFLNTWIRRLLGESIGHNVKINFGSFIKADSVEIGDGSVIGPFSIIIADSFKLGQFSTIKPLTLLSARILDLGSYIQISPFAIISGARTLRSKLLLGDHSRIFPFCWIDSGEGVSIGKNVGIGGHTLIFTHGVWSDMLAGGPVTYAPVRIEDDVWLPWRVFVMPGVTIKSKSIIGANSLITKDVEENSFVAGSPAKLVKSNILSPLTLERQLSLTKKMFREYVEYRNDITISIKDEKVLTSHGLISWDISDLSDSYILFILDENVDIKSINHTEFDNLSIIYYPEKWAIINENQPDIYDFLSFLRRYGIRISINPK